MTNSNQADHAPLLERAFEETPREASYLLENIEGTVPAYLKGSYYLNGPARFERGGQRYRHWLDGDGLVCRLHFSETGVHFTSRYVRSAKYVAEEEAGRPIFRAFGTTFPGGQLKRGIGLESPVNVNVHRFRDTLLAFGEQGLPWELDPETLETRGEYNFSRRLNPISPFSAHPNFDAATGEMFNFGVSFAAHRPCLHLFRFHADGDLAFRQRLDLDGPRSVHDFGLSPSYAVFYLSPYFLDMERIMDQGTTLMDSLRWQPERGSRLLLASRQDGSQVLDIAIGEKYCLHLIDCSEQEGHLRVDILELDQPIYDQYQVPNFFQEVRRARPARYLIDVEAEKVIGKITLGYDRLCDFPTIDPRKVRTDYDQFWFLGITASEQPGRKFLDELVSCRWSQGGAVDRYQTPPFHYLCGEPLFLPDPAREDAGAILCQSFDAKNRRSTFLLFDAIDLARGPIATLPLQEPIHMGFHASWAPEG